MKTLLRVTLGLFAVLLLVVGGVLIGSRGRGFDARIEPSALEAALALRARRHLIPAAERERRNPLPAAADVLKDGRAHFADHCASCHANDGSGETEMGRGLYPKAPDMRLPRTQELTDGELFYIIRQGVPLTGMPGWGSGTPEEDGESWKLVHFIRHLSKLTPQEIDEMAKLNPRTEEEWKAEQEEKAFLEGAGQ